jgi:ribulose bisphosphate carboxylase small subunit
VEKVAIYGREEVGIDDEDKELMDEGNNIRYVRMNSIDVTTECQVQSRIIYY